MRGVVTASDENWKSWCVMHGMTGLYSATGGRSTEPRGRVSAHSGNDPSHGNFVERSTYPGTRGSS